MDGSVYSGKEVELARNAGSLLSGLKLDNNSHLGESHHAVESKPYFSQHCYGSGSWIRCIVDPVSGIRNRFFPDPGYRISDTNNTYIF
jgi:hypothetical protein